MITCIATAGHFWLAINATNNVMVNVDQIAFTVEHRARTYALRTDKPRTEFHFKNKNIITIDIPNDKVLLAVASCKK